MSQVNGQSVIPILPESGAHPCLCGGGCRCRAASQSTHQGERSLRDALRDFERRHIIASLRHHGYDKTQTARALGIGLSSLYRKLEELDIPKSPAEGDGPTDPKGT